MKIADYALSMQASHSMSQQSSVKQSLQVWASTPAAVNSPSSSSQQVSISAAAQNAAAVDQTNQSATSDPNLQLLILLVERLTGQKVRIFDPSQLNAALSGKSARPAAGSGTGLDYSKVASYSESEQTTMQASGSITTSDGKEINFSLNLNMQYQYSESSTTSVKVGDAPPKSDPLVINFNGTAAQLSEQRFSFDLNSNGTQTQINMPSSGSGFLVLDKNNDGKINNGSELFGPGTGNGFSELAKYDSDHNGWIDENDAIFKQLKVWTKDSSGNDQLNSLSSLGVGAISLQSIATPFNIKDYNNQLLGSVRSSSVAINENGTVGSVQQIDLTV